MLNPGELGIHGPPIVGDLKLFEPKTWCSFLAVRDREER
jgi:hypothetical protein